MKILFVCVENSFRSQIAEGFGRRWAHEDDEIYSAGSRPSGIINPMAIRLMKEVGADITTQYSKTLDEYATFRFDAVISMGCGEDCPSLPCRIREDWQIPDPKLFSVEEQRIIRDYIEIKVKDLLSRLTAGL